MILKDGLEFHAAELRKIPGICGDLLTRLPAQIGNTLNERGRFVATDSVATEIRFVTDAPNIRLTLSALKPEFGSEFLEIRVCFGNFESQTFQLTPGVVATVMINPPQELAKIKGEFLRKGPGVGFAPNVCRIIPTRGGLIYCGIDTFGHDVRPPTPEEKPAKTCLFYGSSITNSSADGYPSIAGKRLGMDIINLGMSGSCACEPQLADWMTDRKDWNLAVLELGINMMGYSPEEFRSRVDYLLSQFIGKHPEKPIFLITLYPSNTRFAFRKNPEGEDRESAFCEILRTLYAVYSKKGNLHLLEGDEILDDTSGLSADYLHPRLYGHAVMGLNLAKKLEPFVENISKN